MLRRRIALQKLNRANVQCTFATDGYLDFSVKMPYKSITHYSELREEKKNGKTMCRLGHDLIEYRDLYVNGYSILKNPLRFRWLARSAMGSFTNINFKMSKRTTISRIHDYLLAKRCSSATTYLS